MLSELRKMGGFAELEGNTPRHQRAIDDSDFGARAGGAASSKRAGGANRSHPALILDIMEMMLAHQSEPDNADLVARIKRDAAQPLAALVLECAPVRDSSRDLTATLAQATRAIDAMACILTSLNFSLARGGKLCAVRARIEPPREHHGRAAPPRDVTTSSALADCEPIARAMLQQSKSARELRRDAQLILSCVAMTIATHRAQPVAHHFDDRPEPPCARISEIIQIVENGARPDAPPAAAHNAEEAIARAILVARIAHIFEDYAASLREYVQKIKMHLDLAYAQCAVLINN